MNIKKMFPVLALGIASLFTQAAFAMEGGGSQRDPLDKLNYRMAFDQAAIHKRFKKYLESIGCAENVFGAKADALAAGTHDVEAGEMDEVAAGGAGYVSVPTDAVVIQIESEQEAYEKACLWQLTKARALATTSDARDAVTQVSLVGLGVSGTLVALQYYAAAGAMAGGFGILWVMSETTRSCRPIIKAGYDLAVPPAHVLDELEKLFAINQCFIPKALWPIIIEKFITARTNQFELRSCLNFITFALGLTLYKPKPVPTIEQGAIRTGLDALFEKMDRFFDTYKATEDSERNRWIFKINIAKFIAALCGDTRELPRYLYLHGLGGIGKTHFVNELCTWIEEIIPGAVNHENLVVDTEEKLEGSAELPGVFLCVLRNQLMKNTRGSVVFIDEATWLNRDDMVSPAKRVFNGDQSRLSTSYFGSAVGAAGIDLPVPPMLILVASNEEIKDPALKTRFDVIEFPEPKTETLITHAREIAAASEFLRERGIRYDAFDFAKWIETSKANNFRDVKSQIVPAILSQSGLRHRAGAAAIRIPADSAAGAMGGAGADDLV